MASLTSVELNFLVFRYLQESGFGHSAFSLGYEAGINKCPIDGNVVPPGALITLVQKGLQYVEMEANLGNSDSEMEADFSILQPMDLITKDTEELQKIIKEKRSKEKNKETGEDHDRLLVKERSGTVKDKEREKIHAAAPPEVEKHIPDQVGKLNLNGDGEAGECSDVMILEGHTSEVCTCCWSPTASLLASGSGDSTARIWTIPEGRCKGGYGSVVILNHVKGKANERSKDVTTLDWNSDGSLLATGSYDGQARIWNTSGELLCGLSKHKGPIFSLKWNKRGDYLLTGSFDKSAVVWDVVRGHTNEWKQLFEFHSGHILDVDWRTNLSFATASSDHLIFVCKVGDDRPVKTFSGHRGEVNCVKWDPTRSLLASCSDDTTAKIWNMKQDTCVHDLRQHVKEIYTVRWSPTGTGTANPNQALMLASASFDSTVKLWDVELGRALHSLERHTSSVYSVAFSPNGEYLATGSLDKCIHVWSVREGGRIVRTFTGNAGIFEVSWNKEGDKIAACFANHTLSVLDFRM